MSAALHYLDRLGPPFLFLEEREVHVAPDHRHIVVNHLPKAVLVLEGTLRHRDSQGNVDSLHPGCVLLNFSRRRNTYLAPEGRKSGRIRVLRLTLPWEFSRPDRTARTSAPAGATEPDLGKRIAERLPTEGVLEPEPFGDHTRRVAELRACLTSREAERRFQANAIARLIFLSLIRFANRTPSPESPSGWADRIERFLDANLQRPLALEDVARALGRSEEHLARLFRSARGTTIFRELRRLRIERARYLLLCTDLSLTRIAEETGFQTLAHFSRTFREDSGAAPSAFRDHAGFQVLQAEVRQ